MRTITELELRLQNMGASDNTIREILEMEDLGIGEPSKMIDCELRNLIDRQLRKAIGF